MRETVRVGVGEYVSVGTSGGIRNGEFKIYQVIVEIPGGFR